MINQMRCKLKICNLLEFVKNVEVNMYICRPAVVIRIIDTVVNIIAIILLDM